MSLGDPKTSHGCLPCRWSTRYAAPSPSFEPAFEGLRLVFQRGNDVGCLLPQPTNIGLLFASPSTYSEPGLRERSTDSEETQKSKIQNPDYKIEKRKKYTSMYRHPYNFFTHRRANEPASYPITVPIPRLPSTVKTPIEMRTQPVKSDPSTRANPKPARRFRLTQTQTCNPDPNHNKLQLRFQYAHAFETSKCRCRACRY